MRARLLKLLFQSTAWMPLPLAHAVGRLFGWLNYLIANKNKRIAAINLALCFPELDNSPRKTLLRNSLIETAKAVTEMGIIWMANPQRVLSLIKQVEGEEHLQQARANGQGILLTLPHIGCWEIIGNYCSVHYPMTSLYRPPRIPELENIIRDARERSGSTLVPTDNTGVRAISKALKNTELVAILPDQEPGTGNGVFAPFFNHQAYTMTLVPRLAHKLNSAVIYAYTERLPRGKGFKLIFKPASAGIDSKDLQAATEIMNRDVEEIVRGCPEQYQWTYKRFKTRPEGESKFY